ncbi:MAG: glycosyltransferase [Anditalea sp.]
MEGNQKIRVLHCIETISSGGVERTRLSLSRYLDKEVYEQKIICTQASGTIPKEITMEGVEVIVIGKLKHTFHWSQYRKVIQVIRSFQPHIIHGAVFEGVSMSTVSGFLGRVPIIIAEETSDPINRSHKANLLFKLLTSVADRVIGIAPGVINYLTNIAHINASKIQLINNGVEIPRKVFEEEIMSLKERLGLSNTNIIIGSVGRIRDKVKLFSDIIEAVALLPDHAKLKILIVGQGPDVEFLKDLAAQRGLKNQLIMPGAQMDTPPFYCLMDIFCIVSDNEGFGLVAAEAMFHRLPVIATAVGGLKDIVVDGETGFLVPSHSPKQIAEKLQLLIDQPALRKNMGAKGLARAKKKYSAKIYVEKVHQLYQELLREKGLL